MEHFRELPSDVWNSVLVCADHRTLKQLRLVSKAINRLVEPVLFSTVNLRVTKSSFQRLSKIAHAERLRQHVQGLYYNIRLLPWDLPNASAWKTCVQDRATNFAVRAKKDGSCIDTLPARGSVSPRMSQLRIFYDNYIDYVNEQKDIHRGESEIILLTQSFTKLPRLSRIELSGREAGIRTVFVDYGTNDAIDIDLLREALRDQISEVSADTLLEPNFLDGGYWTEGRDFVERRLVKTLTAMHRSNLPLKHILVRGLDAERLSIKIGDPVKAALLCTIPLLQTFTVSFREPRDVTHSTVPCTLLHRILELTTGVESLVIGFEVEENYQGPPPLPQRADFGQTFSFMSSLSLFGMCINASTILPFLCRHSPFLRRLYFRNMDIVFDGTAPLAPTVSLEVQPKECSSWVDMVHYISRVLSLEHFGLDGLIMYRNHKAHPVNIEDYVTLNKARADMDSWRPDEGLFLSIFDEYAITSRCIFAYSLVEQAVIDHVVHGQPSPFEMSAKVLERLAEETRIAHTQGGKMQANCSTIGDDMVMILH